MIEKQIKHFDSQSDLIEKTLEQILFSKALSRNDALAYLQESTKGSKKSTGVLKSYGAFIKESSEERQQQ